MGRLDRTRTWTLYLLATNPLDFRADMGWLHAIDWNAVNVRPLKWEDEDYGALWSRRRRIRDGIYSTSMLIPSR